MESGRAKGGGSGLFQPVRLIENVHYVSDAAMFALGLEAHLHLEHAAGVSCDHFLGVGGVYAGHLALEEAF